MVWICHLPGTRRAPMISHPLSPRQLRLLASTGPAVEAQHRLPALLLRLLPLLALLGEATVVAVVITMTITKARVWMIIFRGRMLLRLVSIAGLAAVGITVGFRRSVAAANR